MDIFEDVFCAKCSAPICPVLKETLNSIWYPTEEFCRRSGMGDNILVKNQRKIVKNINKRIEKKGRKKVKEDLYSDETFFTVRMICRPIGIKGGIVGLDPDMDISNFKEEENRWIRNHPVKKEKTEEQKQAFKERLKKGICGIYGTIQIFF